MSSTIQYGWAAVPRDTAKFVASLSSSNTKPATASSVPIPSTPLAQNITALATKHLPVQTVNHCYRAYIYGSIIMAQHFPKQLASWPDFAETFYLTCMLHDIGTAKTFHHTTKMSFDFKGAFIASSWLSEASAPQDLIDSVAETIIRHQDIGTTGSITILGGITIVATLLDNAGQCGDLVAKETIESVVKAYPRNKWSGCFASTVRSEIEGKPWAHSTHIEQFAEKVEGNTLMEPYEGEPLP
ncbi:hypothetical protein BGZ74_002134 [Mortierella antarctica]|nr:hypothetical protein BGZ74_002134 [Mortierella antarctica]